MRTTLALFSSLLLAGCIQNQCEPENDLARFAEPGTEAYYQTLVNELNAHGSDELSYYFSGITTQGPDTLINVNVIAEDMCATFPLIMPHWSGLETLKELNGKGYHGAELGGLEFRVLLSPNGHRFEFQKLVAVID